MGLTGVGGQQSHPATTRAESLLPLARSSRRYARSAGTRRSPRYWPAGFATHSGETRCPVRRSAREITALVMARQPAGSVEHRDL